MIYRLVPILLALALAGSLSAQNFTNVSAPTILATDPATCGPSQWYFNSTTNTFRWCTGTNTWTSFGTVNSSTPTNGQLAQWTNATTIAGITPSGDLSLSGSTFTVTQIEGAAIPASAALLSTNSSKQLVAAAAAVAPIAVSATGAISISGAAGQIPNGASGAFTATPALGTDGSVAGTLQLSNSAASFHSIISSAATANNTVALFASVPTNGDLVDCATASTTCTLTDSNVLASNVMTTTSTLTANLVVLGNGTKTATVSGLQYNGGIVSASTQTSTITYEGGLSGATAGGQMGSVIFQGGNITSGAGTDHGGNLVILGGSNAATSATGQAGSVFIAPGSATGSTQGLQGLFMEALSYQTGTANTKWNLECSNSTTAMSVTDCGATPGNVMGVAELVNSNTVIIIHAGQTFVNASAAVTVGHTACSGSTAGEVTDSGGATKCTTWGGVVIATSGAFVVQDTQGSVQTYTATTTLPLIQIQQQ